MKFDFEKLELYQKAIGFTNDIYNLTKKFPREERFGLVAQLCRAAASISLNIAEGSGRSKKDFKHFLNMARTSVHECVPLLRISCLQRYITSEDESVSYERCIELAKMVCGLISSL